MTRILADRISHLARILALATLTGSLAGCGGVGLVGNGKSTTQTREVGAFKKIEISGGVQVTFKKGPRAVAITADDNLIDLIETVVRDDSLVVRVKQPISYRSGVTAVISNDALEGLWLSGGSGFVGPATPTSNFDIEASGGSSIELTNLTATQVSVSASGGSDIVLTGGAATKLVISASGGSTVSSHGFVSESGAVEVSGGSVVCIKCTSAVTGNVSGGSILTVSGSPKSLTVNSSGGSRLIKEN